MSEHDTPPPGSAPHRALPPDWGTKPHPALDFPTRIGRYEVRAVIGEGTFGRVYRAFDPELDREFAINVFKPEVFLPESRDALLTRNRLAALIHHPNVCPVYEVGTLDGLPFVVMRYVAGGTLKSLLERHNSRLPARAAAVIARKLALGLAAAHSAGMIHCDLTPAGVLYDEADREVLITGFGTAPGEDGGFAVTPAYMAPEQVQGQGIGPQTDVYSLGVIFYELLAGRVPFTGSVRELVRGHLETPPTPPSVVRPGLDPRLDALCLKALEKHPADRYRTAKEFADALSDYLKGRTPGGRDRPRAAGVESADADLTGDQPSLTDAPSSVFSGSKPAPAAPPEDEGAIDWDAAAILSDDEATRGPPKDTSLSGILFEKADPDEALTRASKPAARDDEDGDPSVTVDWMANSAGEAPTPPPARTKPAKPEPRGKMKPSRSEPGEYRARSRGGRVRVVRVKKVRPITDKVHFSLTAPAAMRAGQRYALSVWAHLAAQLAEVIVRAERASGPVQIHTKGGVSVARGTRLTVQLRIPAFPIAAPDDTDVIEWNGEIGNATFPVHVPPDARPGGYDGTALIYAAGVQIAKLHFVLQVALADAAVGPVAAREVRHKRAFASYASQDRKAVLARIQGIQKVAPDLEIFVDVASLRSGERWADRLEREVTGRDVFYLFWSAGASTSEWVEREWRAALQARGLDYIDPVPLVDPAVVPPPPELAGALHFNDWVLAYLRGADAEPEVIVEYRRPFPWLLLAMYLVLVIGGALAGMYFSGLLDPLAK